jgi:hypothetical protein
MVNEFCINVIDRRSDRQSPIGAESVEHLFDRGLRLPRARRDPVTAGRERSQVIACNSRSVAARTIAVRRTLCSGANLFETIPRTGALQSPRE